MRIYADGRKKLVFRNVGKTSNFYLMRVLQNGINAKKEPLRYSKISDSIALYSIISVIKGLFLIGSNIVMISQNNDIGM